MRLNTFVAREVERLGTNRTAVLKDLAKKAKVSLLTLQSVERGAMMRLFDKAKSVSEATGGEVTIMELCDDRAAEIAPKGPKFARVASPSKEAKAKGKKK